VRQAGHEGLTAEEVMCTVNADMAAFKHIKEVQFLDVIPKSASGKILRRVLRDMSGPERPAN